VPKGRIEDPPAPKIKIFSSAPAAGGCLPPLQHISALQHTFSRIFAFYSNFIAKRIIAETYAQVKARIEQIIASINTESKFNVRRFVLQHNMFVKRFCARLTDIILKNLIKDYNKKLFKAQKLVLYLYLNLLFKIGVYAKRYILQTAKLIII